MSEPSDFACRRMSGGKQTIRAVPAPAETHNTGATGNTAWVPAPDKSIRGQALRGNDSGGE